MKLNRKIIYLDFDGVMANLDKGLKDFIKEYYNITFKPKDGRDKESYKYLPYYTECFGFQHQPLMSKAYDLIDYVASKDCNIAVLTSCGQFSYVPEVNYQKRVWFETNFTKYKNIPFVTTTSGKDKAILAHNNCMLIDDHSKNIDAFIKAGGHGFVYSEDVFEECKQKITEFLEG